jgi:hypothetical protein
MLRMSLGNTDRLATIANCTCIECTILRALYNPAKLAELMAVGLLARETVRVTVVVELGQITVARWTGWGNESLMQFEWVRKDVSMPQARALLAAIMATPADESSRETCERIVREEGTL